MKKRLFVLIVLVVGAFAYLHYEAPLVINNPTGGATEVVSENQHYTLSYDLKATIDNATSMDWGCKCPIGPTFKIDGEVYTVFEDCSSQDGNQLIQRGDKYYLISAKLDISE